MFLVCEPDLKSEFHNSKTLVPELLLKKSGIPSIEYIYNIKL
jgi:hypothetical protein